MYSASNHMRFKLVFSLVIVLYSFNFSQERVYELGYLYQGSDTLDVEDGGCTKTRVIFQSIQSDSIANSYIIKGQIIDEVTGEEFDGSWGRIFLGTIDTINAKTWLGYTETGLLIKDKEFTMNDRGAFRLELPQNEKNNLIFTGIGCTVEVFTIAEIKRILK